MTSIPNNMIGLVAIFSEFISLRTSHDNTKQLASNIFEQHFRLDNLSVIKEYIKYYNNKKLVQWLVNLLNLDYNNIGTILDGNIKINSCLEEIIEHLPNKDSYKTKLFGTQTNKIIKDMVQMSLLDDYTIDMSNNIFDFDILQNDIAIGTTFFDTIFFDFPTDIHNIIHANCCMKIKKLKLRGTKAEPLLLQLLMMSLNKNGKAILIVPDSLLFSDSNQVVETRKYLLEHFNVKNIIDINNIYTNVKSSVLYFENTGKTTKIEFSKLTLNDNNIISSKIIDININNMTDIYSLWYKHYMDLNKVMNNDITYKSVEQLFNMNNKSKHISIDKYYKNDSSIKIVDMNTNGDITLCEKEVSTYFYTYYLDNILRNNYEKFVKGKLNQFDVDKIKKYMIPIISNDKQNIIINYLKTSDQIIEDNNKNINNFLELKKFLLETIPADNMIELNMICQLYEKETIDCKLIGVIRNGLSAGSVYMAETISNNSYYISINNNNMIEYVYHWMKYKEDKLKELSNLTTQSNLNKSNLLSLKISSIDMDSQRNIVLYCNEFDNNIMKLVESNNTIKNKNIFSTILNLYKF